MLNKLPKSSDTSHFQRGLTRAPLSRKRGAGFTLVELVVVIGTMAILFSLGYANYRDFQRRQQLESVVRAFKVDMRLAQQLALTGKKESECDALEGYRVMRIEVSPPTPADQFYEIGAVCDGTENCTNTPSYCIKTVKLPANIRIGSFPSPGNRFMFQVLARGVDRDTDTTITFTQNVTSDTRSVIITPSGEIK